MLGGLYRGGYDEIKIIYNESRILPTLQGAVDSFYGFEIFDISDKSCMIKSVYNEEGTEIQSHISRMMHIIKTMQGIVVEDIKSGKFNSRDQLFQFRVNVLKQRDIISRIIQRQKLFDDAHFPYYRVALALWTCARNYYLLYKHIGDAKSVGKKSVEYLMKTNEFFSISFKSMNKFEFSKEYVAFRDLREKGFVLLKNEKENSVIVSFCIAIIMAVQSAYSSRILLSHMETKI